MDAPQRAQRSGGGAPRAPTAAFVSAVEAERGWSRYGTARPGPAPPGADEELPRSAGGRAGVGGGSAGGCVGEEKGKKKVEAAPLRSRPPFFQLLIFFYFTLNLFMLGHFGDLHAVRDVQVL